MDDFYDLIVIGGGSAGLVAAGGAGLLGAKVALIEKHKLGGDCLWKGCVPSKALIRSARFAHQAKQAEKYGFERVEPRFANDTFSSIPTRIHRVIETIKHHDSPERFEGMGVEVIFGSPRFISPSEVEIYLHQEGPKKVLKAKRFCISTGSRPFVPPVPGLEETGFITNEEVFELEKLPGKLVILGGGAIGLELGQAFSRLGSEVSIVEMADRLLIKEDAETSVFIEASLIKEGLRVFTKTKATGFMRSEDGRKVAICEKDGKTFELYCDEILCAAGRQVNTDGLGLENAGVEFNRKGILTDSYLRTSRKHIFAAGDITGNFQFTHTADYEAQVVLQNAFVPFPFKKKVDFSVVPWATFTDPEVARVGLSEAEARAKLGDRVKALKTTFTDNDRANAESETDGFAKLILNGNKIIGVHIIGPHAGELIHEFVVAMKKGLSLADLNEAIHIYPTFGKITQALATEQTIEGLASPFVKKWFARYLKIWR